jgi:glycosyltransferase involved in cell wall biosynthesis
MVQISVIIPTYNRRELLFRCVQSVIEQTLSPTEIIIVDDGSKECPKELHQKLCCLTRIPIKLVRNKLNRGASYSRNRGGNLAVGNWLAFLDSDDYWENQKLEKQAQLLRDREVDVVYCDNLVIDNQGRKRPSGKKIVSGDILPYLLSGWIPPNTSTIMLKRSAFLMIDGFDEDLSSCQDHDLWIRIAVNRLVVQGLPTELSCFTTDAKNRISFDLDRRSRGVRTFLKKWKIFLFRELGFLRCLRFKWWYVQITIYPIFIQQIKNRNFLIAGTTYFRFLALNPCFYIACIRIFKARIFTPYRG